MQKLEDLLPPERQFEARMAEVDQSVREILDDAVEAGDIIIPDKEFDSSIEDLWMLSGILANLAARTPEDVDTLTVVSYRSFILGLQLADNISAQSAGLISLQYFRDKLEEHGAFDSISRDVRAYFEQRPALKSLVEDCVDEVDTVGGQGGHVETVTGVTLMLVEQQEATRLFEAGLDSPRVNGFFEGNTEA